MARGKASGITVSASDVPILIGMVARGDRRHDIAAWFGINQGRVKEAEDGKFGPATTNASVKLPPKGPPGIKGRHLRDTATQVLEKLKAGEADEATKMLEQALKTYNADEA